MSRPITAPIIGLILIAACAATSDISDGTGAVFYGPSDKIKISDNQIIIGSQSYSLLNCSTGVMYCYRNDQLGLLIEFPRKCNDQYWVPRPGSGLRWAFANPHRTGAVYANIEKSNFLYEWYTDQGLMAIYYNRSANLTANPVLGIRTAKVYTRRTKHRLFACRN